MVFIFLFILFFITAFYFFFIFPRITNRKAFSALDHMQFAHRGYHCADRLIPENSMAAFQSALSKGYGIELDIHLTRDHKLVVFHDNSLQRMCGRPGIIEKSSYEELKKFHLLNTSERIPLFSDVLHYVNGRVPLLIELKIPDNSLKICEVAYKELFHYKGSFLIQSFNTMGLYWFRKNAPHILRGQLSSDLTKTEAGESYICRFLVKHLLCNILGRPDFISYKMADLPAAGVFFCQKLFRIPIAVWTLRTPETLEEGRKWYNFQIFEKNFENY